jgi:alkyl hydroperoxide reductase subunit AhpC
VVAATRELGVTYPVVQDNDFAIWRRYGTWAWPSAVIADKKGIVRYTHIGEGAYRDTEDVIRRLLAEP